MTANPAIYQLAQYILWFFVYAFMGWCWEVGLRLVQHHVFVNRGFVTGPVLPIYGFGALISVVLLHPIHNVLIQFVVGALAAATMEYVTSWAMEKLFHARWWDYTGKPFNLNGRIYLLGVVVFGIMMVVIDRLVQPLLQDATDAIPPLTLEIVSLVLLLTFLVDLITSVIHMKNFNKRLAAVQEKVAELADNARDRAAEIRDAASSAAEQSKQRISDAVDARRDAFESHLQKLHESYHVRRTLHDPHFFPTSNKEAYRWLQEREASRKTKDRP